MPVTSLYIGLMSGTSMDGIDAGLFDIRGNRCVTVATHSSPYPEALRECLMTASRKPENCTVDLIGTLDTWVGDCFRSAAEDLLNKSGVSRKEIRAIGSHGQTLRHKPRNDRPYTLQIGDPNLIAAGTGITTVADFRRRDLALGGEGAPLATAFHRHFLADARENRVILNIGGFANITILPTGGGPVRGFDTGPGNTLLDAWIQSHKKQPYDSDGAWGNSGRIDESLLALLRDDAYFRAAPPKSTGFEYFNLAWLQERVATVPGNKALTAVDVQATLAALTASTIADAVHEHAPATERLLVCGGGVKNSHLMRLLADKMPAIAIASTAAHGIEPGWVEAATFAWLAQRRLDGLAGNLPAVTGASAEAVLGGIWFGSRDDQNNAQ
ncbi:MAG: anhydro-N-acetylmuramic acid kinase [Woeseia sp.]